MMMMKEGIFAGHHSLALLHLHFALASLALAPLALTHALLALASLTLVNYNGKTQAKTAKPVWPKTHNFLTAPQTKNRNHFLLLTSQKIDTFIDFFLISSR